MRSVSTKQKGVYLYLYKRSGVSFQVILFWRVIWEGDPEMELGIKRFILLCHKIEETEAGLGYNADLTSVCKGKRGK